MYVVICVLNSGVFEFSITFYVLTEKQTFPGTCLLVRFMCTLTYVGKEKNKTQETIIQTAVDLYIRILISR